MTLKNAWGWVALGIGTVAVMAALVHVERQWQAYSLEERGRALVAEEQRDTLLNRWPLSRLGALDHKTPAEVAGDPRYRVRLLAAILLLETRITMRLAAKDLADLRDQLRLPQPEPIPPGQDIIRMPVVRLPRLMIEQLSDMSIVFRHAVRFETLAGEADGFFLQVREHVHARRVEPDEERCFALCCSGDELLCRREKFFVDRLHPLGGKRPGVLDLLLAAAVGTLAP